jgi:hypothetical protein
MTSSIHGSTLVTPQAQKSTIWVAWVGYPRVALITGLALPVHERSVSLVKDNVSRSGHGRSTMGVSLR